MIVVRIFYHSTNPR